VAKRKATRKKIVKKNIARGVVYISATYNNTVITVTMRRSRLSKMLLPKPKSTA